MKIKEFIQLFESLGYDENTDLIIGAFDLNGDWYSFDFEVEDEDRKLNPETDNSIAITLDPSEDYITARCGNRFNPERIADKIYDSVYWILTHDE